MRVDRTPTSNLWISSITVEEILRGRFEQVKREIDNPGEVEFYSQQLVDTVKYLAGFNLMPYKESAAKLFLSWPGSIRRHGANDCRIAAIAVIEQFTIVTSDRDFSHIPNAKWENWL